MSLGHIIVYLEFSVLEKFLSDPSPDVAQRHFNGQITDEEFVNAVFEPQEQVSARQAELLGAAFTLAVGGPAQVHVGTGGGEVSSDLPWSEKKRDNNMTSFKRKR